jgi:hypothetical protein
LIFAIDYLPFSVVSSNGFYGEPLVDKPKQIERWRGSFGAPPRYLESVVRHGSIEDQRGEYLHRFTKSL